jgi:hypothetical protein
MCIIWYFGIIFTLPNTCVRINFQDDVDNFENIGEEVAIINIIKTISSISTTIGFFIYESNNVSFRSPSSR